MMVTREILHDCAPFNEVVLVHRSTRRFDHDWSIRDVFSRVLLRQVPTLALDFVEFRYDMALRRVMLRTGEKTVHAFAVGHPRDLYDYEKPEIEGVPISFNVQDGFVIGGTRQRIECLAKMWFMPEGKVFGLAPICYD